MIAVTDQSGETLEAFLRQEQSKDLLRLCTAGSVDDGKSTLIGRLLYDSQSIYEDQLESMVKASVGRNVGTIDFSLLTDGLRAEREQGITIDVAYRHFATARRKFIIADVPGHEQYTRNMVTGASTADVAVVLVDARKGLLAQSRRHATIAVILGLPHLVVAVNKMDLIDYNRAAFDRIEQECRNFLSTYNTDIICIPISALTGDNVVKRSEKTAWYGGPSLLDYLEHVPLRGSARSAAFRLAVQRVARPHADFRGYAGTVLSGSVQRGDSISIFPSCQMSAVAAIHTFDGDIDRANTGEAITIILREEIDVGRGDLLTHTTEPPNVANNVLATLVWLDDTAARIGRRYLIKHMTRQENASIREIRYQLSGENLQTQPAMSLERNGIGLAHLELSRPLAFDPYIINRTTGSFILIDPVSNATVAGGMILKAVASEEP